MDNSFKEKYYAAPNFIFSKEALFRTNRFGNGTVRRLDFKQNCKYFRRDLRRIKEYASEIQNIYFSKS